MATARIIGGYGNVPGYGKVTAPKKPKTPASLLGDGGPNSMRSGAARALNPPSPPATPAPGGGGGGGGAAAASPKFDPNNLPVDSAYEQQIAGINNGRDNTVLGLAGQRESTLGEYGYSATYKRDPVTGNVTGVESLKVDPNNPYGRAAQLKRSYDQSKSGTRNSLADRGQLYAGSMINAQNSNDRGFLQGQDSMQKSLGQILAAIIGQEGAARTEAETAGGVAYGDRVDRARNNYTANPPPADEKPPPDPTTTAGVKAMLASAPKITGTYKNASGRETRVFADGHKEVLVNGVWKRV
jgi:hypothetical protein